MFFIFPFDQPSPYDADLTVLGFVAGKELNELCSTLEARDCPEAQYDMPGRRNEPWHSSALAKAGTFGVCVPMMSRTSC